MRNSCTRLWHRVAAPIAGAALAIAGVSCSTEKKNEPVATETSAAPVSSIKYTEVSSFIGTYCSASGCHDSTTKSGSYNTTTRAGVAAKASTAASRIESTSLPMPPDGSAQKTAFAKEAAGKANLLAWLKAGAPE